MLTKSIGLYFTPTKCGAFYSVRKFSSTQNLKYLLKCFQRSKVLVSSQSQKYPFPAIFKRNKSAVADLKTNDMRAWQVDNIGLKYLSLRSTYLPTITSPNDVLIKVTASSVNHLDILMLDENTGGRAFSSVREYVDECQGQIPNPGFPMTVGRDFVGEVIRVGQSVTDVKIEDKVWGVVLPHYQGCHSDFVVANSCVVCPKPENVSDIEAASIPFIGLTAFQAINMAGISPNQGKNLQILIIGATGGVGTFMTQILSMWGAEVSGLCREEGFELALSCGASHVYDYKDPDIIYQIEANAHFDVIFDVAGTNNNMWINVLKSKPFSSYVTLKSPFLTYTDKEGILLGTMKTFANLMRHNMTILPEGKVSKWGFFLPNKSALNSIGRLLSEKKIRPVIDQVFKFDEAKNAYEYFVNKSKKGKIMIDFT